MIRPPYLVNGTRIPDETIRQLLERPADETRESGCEFRILPPELCRLTDPDDVGRSCCCPICRPPIGPQAPSYWDTLASAIDGRYLRV
jgi:hypothetical protein